MSPSVPDAPRRGRNVLATHGYLEALWRDLLHLAGGRRRSSPAMPEPDPEQVETLKVTIETERHGHRESFTFHELVIDPSKGHLSYSSVGNEEIEDMDIRHVALKSFAPGPTMFTLVLIGRLEPLDDTGEKYRHEIRPAD